MDMIAVSVPRFGAMLGITKRKVYQIAKTGDVDTFMLDSRLRVTLASVQRYVDRVAAERSSQAQPSSKKEG